MADRWLSLFVVTIQVFAMTDAAFNVAKDKPANMSSLETIHGGGGAHLAVDGNLSTEIHTGPGEAYAWWRVDLETQVTNARIVVYFRTDYELRRPGLMFYTSNSSFSSPVDSFWSPPSDVQLINTTTGSHITIPDNYTIQTTGQWRYLLIYTITRYSGSPLYSALDFKEIEVWACNEGFYDPDCNNNCSSRRCNGQSSCSYDNGKCDGGCQIGFKVPDCSTCSDSLFGPNCDKNCSLRECLTASTSCPRDGMCDGGCRDGFQGPHCFECLPGRYHQNCERNCSARNCEDTNTECSRDTYTCACTAGWEGEDCTTECADTRYGANCSEECTDRNCLTHSTTCDRFTGVCPEGCKVGYQLPDCILKCADTRYGANCSEECTNRNCLTHSTTCDRFTGVCPEGCKVGYQLPDCILKCADTRYGANCSEECTNRNCLTHSTTCDRFTGVCPEGCKVGYQLPDCILKCADTRYGANCSEECTNRNCLTHSTTCDRFTGVCPEGCKVGYQLPDCILKCADTRYGANCSEECTNRNCITKSTTCDRLTGVCPDGCKAGYQLPDCTLTCSAGKHGSQCDSVCGNCLNGSSCHHETGICSEGCKEGFKPGLCVEAIKVNPSDGSNLAPIVGGAVGGVLAIAVVVFAIVIIKRRRTQEKHAESIGQKFKPDNVYVNAEAEDIRDEINTNAADKPKVKREEQKPVTTEVENKQKQDSHVEEDVRSKPQVAVKPTIVKSPEKQDVEEEMLDVEDVVYINLPNEDPIREVAVSELADVVKKIQERKNGFVNEFAYLPSDFSASYDDSRKPENAGKNKFRGYYPYNHNRVKLKGIPGVPGSDYINASIMKSHDTKKTYIAAQAALKQTVGDFWRMIWQYKCNRIVMLTGLVEQLKVKCEKYWPDKDTVLDTGHFDIKLEHTDVRADYTIRHIKITPKSANEQRTVVHYHYTTWPDHGVPNILSLAKFIWNIRRTASANEGPLLVHCSAGIGRTGTYIALDSLYDQARDEGKVNVPAYVAEMRSQRKNMIQTHEQYECVFLCLIEMTTYGDTSLSSSDFVNMYSSRGMDTEVDGRSLKQLAEMVLVHGNDGDRQSSRMWVDGNDNFVVRYSQSLANPKGYLQAVFPPETLTHLLWKLVEENNVETILVISRLEGSLTAAEDEVKIVGAFKLTTQKIETLSEGLNMVTVQLESDSCKDQENARTIKLYQMTEPSTMETLSTFLISHDQLQTVSTSTHPAVILHSEAERKESVLLSIKANILGEIVKDYRVDVISHVRRTLLHSADVTLTQDDIEALYRFADQCVQLTDNSSVYVNL